MPRFGVRLRGEGLEIEVDGRRLPGGFFTTRFVDASDDLAAAEAASDRVAAELPDEMWHDPHHRAIVVEEVWQVSWWTRRLSAGGGFAFYAWESDTEPPAHAPSRG